MFNYFDLEWFFGDGDFLLCLGVVLVIELMVNIGIKDMCVFDDYWIVVIKDGFFSVYFEYMVVLILNGVC